MLVNAVNEVNRYNVQYDRIASVFDSGLHACWSVDVHSLSYWVSCAGIG